MAVTTLLDIDHYAIYAIRRRDLNISRAYDFFDKTKRRKKWIRARRKIFLISILHTYEFMILLGITSLFYNQLFVVFAAVAFHVCIDIALNPDNPEHRKNFLKHLSFLYYVAKKEKVFGEIFF